MRTCERARSTNCGQSLLWYSFFMTKKDTHKQLGNLVEQKILEFFGDPDSGLTLKTSFLNMLHKRMKKSQKFTSNSAVMQKYGIS